MSPPADKMFAVYVDADRIAYDWDWKDAAGCDPDQTTTNPTLPRFRRANPAEDLAELIVANASGQQIRSFRAGYPWYSVAGDCVFCYFEEHEAFEERVDEYLTKYIAFGSGECTGFKLKYVSRLFDLVRKWAIPDDESIVMHVELGTFEVDLEFLMRAWLMNSLPKRLPLS
ncbi:MAG: hypothetical protein M3O30_10450 [Planctomycetota bacterium]|nr:hypothetical protein [Planctomycetota bacterium]